MLKNYLINRDYSGSTLVYYIFGLTVLVIAFLVIKNTVLTNKSEVIAENAIQSAAKVSEKTSEPVTENVRAILHNSIAVLPFENLSPNPEDAFITTGFHQDLILLLAQIKDLSVIAHTGVVILQDNVRGEAIISTKYPSDMPISKIASALNVETIMKGTVRYADNRINIDVQLFGASGNKQLWSEAYDRELTDVTAVQAEIVEHTAMTLGADISDEEIKRISKPPTSSLEAYKLYLKARVLVSHLEAGMPSEFYQYLDQAIAVDPNFALAHALKASGHGIAHTFSNRSRLPSLDDVEKITAVHTEKALTLDPDLSFTHLALASLHFIHGRTLEAKQAYQRALQLGPNVNIILSSYAHFLTHMEEYDEGIPLAERAQALTPNDASWHARIGVPLMFAGKSIAAADHFRQGLQYQEHPWLHKLVGLAEYRSGNNAEAIKELRLAEQLQAAAGRGPDALTAYAYSRLGLQEDATRLANEVEASVTKGKYISTANWTFPNLAIGKIDKAYDILSQGLNKGVVALQYVKSNVMNDPVLEQPRFVELRNQIGSLN